MTARGAHDGGEDVHLRPTVKNEINWATVAAIFGMLVTASGAVYQSGKFTTRAEGVEKRVDVMEIRLQSVETVASKLDNLAYRVTVQEQGAQALSKSIEELKRSLADQSADLRVIREILTRLDKQGK